MPVLSVEGVTKRYRDVTALDRVSLSVEAGEVVCLLGPNGAGKTTLIELALGLRTPNAGRIAVFGGHPASRATRVRVGAMLQDTDAPEAQTVRETVDLVRHYYPWSLPRDEILRRADLIDKARTKVGQLSGGQRQRLSFAMAIAGDPALVFLDEPTAALDVEARQDFWGQIRAFAASGGTTVFSTHHPDEVQTLVRRVVVVARGRIVADGTPEGIRTLVGAGSLESAYLQLTARDDHRHSGRYPAGSAEEGW